MATALLQSEILSRTEHRPKTLAGVLAHLGYEVFPEEQVVQFQKDYAAKAVRAAIRKRRNKAFATAMIIIALCGILVRYTDVSWIALCVCIFSLYVVEIVYEADIEYIRQQLRWWCTHPKPIPSDVHKKVKTIRGRLPKATFYVERFQLDPFLWVEHGDQRYCIAHWDEPFTDR